VTTRGPEPTSPATARSLAERLEEVWTEAARRGARMPGEPALAAALQSSRPAVREALVRLEERGYIHRRKGADTAVNASLLDIPARFDRRLEKSDLIAAMGHTPTIDVLAVETSPVTPEEAEEYAVAADTPVLRVTKRWSADGRPVLLAHDAVPITTATDPATVDPATPLVDQALALAGERAEWEVVWPRADALSADEAEATDRAAGEPVLALDVSGVAPSGAVCYWTAELHLKDAFRYAMVRRAEWR
jgi:GntR family transcriptional regulator